MKISPLILMVTFIVSCPQGHSIQSTNRTGPDIAEDVHQRIFESMPRKHSFLSIANISRFKTGIGIEEVEVCYEAVADNTRYYGLIAHVNGKWFVSSPVKEWITTMCPESGGL
jgi:hypothetical protein